MDATACALVLTETSFPLTGEGEAFVMKVKMGSLKTSTTFTEWWGRQCGSDSSEVILEGNQQNKIQI